MTGPDELHALRNALPPAARQHLVVNHQTIPWIRAATQRHGTPALARILANGISWNHPANPAALIKHRLRREARADNDQEEDR